jgi:hypothetical protein
VTISYLEIARTILQWLKRRRQDELEKSVLDTFGHRNWPWLSARGVVARMKHDAAYAHARALFPPSVSDMASLMSWFAWVPSYVGYRLRRLSIPRPERADRVLRDLFKQGWLACAPENPSLYRLKY